jgi:hypothetical protein
LFENRSPEDNAMISLIRQHLLREQFAEERGIDSTHAAYGGWGFGEKGLRYGTTGHVDISNTRRVLEALSLVLSANHPSLQKAQKYLDRVQNDFVENIPRADYLDGGFFTSIVTPETNKSAKIIDIEDTWHSYATATCDGLLALLATGVAKDDRRAIQARDWLDQHQNIDYPEGIPLDDPLQWHRVMRYYHLAVRAEAYAQMPFSLNKDGLWKILSSEQREDGSYLNPMGEPNKEDDPLISTTLAVIAMVKTLNN